MYIKDRLRYYYYYGMDSVEYELSRFILMNFQQIPNYTLTDISIETGISKATISRFIKLLTLGGNYVLFTNTIRLEIQTPVLTFSNNKDNLQRIEKDFPLIKQSLNTKQIEELATSLIKHDTIYFLGDSISLTKVSYLTDQLIFLHKDVKYRDDFELLSCLKENEMAIIVAPEWNIYDYIIQSTLCADVKIDVSSLQGEIYFIGNGQKEYHGFKIITLGIFQSELLNHLLLEYMAYYICSELTKQ